MAEEPGSGDAPEPTRRRRPSPQPAQHPLARSGFIEYDRVIFFSDAVFAIAITLLAVNLRVTHGQGVGSAHDLHAALPAIFGFGISFLVIAFFWIGHHAIFRYITAFDRPLIALNLTFLGLIAFLPYPTAVLSASKLTAAVIFYACCCAIAGSLEAAIWLYATRPGTKLTSADAVSVRRFYAWRTLRVPVVFLLSIPIAIPAPGQAPYFWLLVAVSGTLINRFWRPSGPAEPNGDQTATTAEEG